MLPWVVIVAVDLVFCAPGYRFLWCLLVGWFALKSKQKEYLIFSISRQSTGQLVTSWTPQMTATGMLAGTPNFMSPEQTRGLELDGRSDLFGQGGLMYRASIGKLPFGTTGILATLQSIQHDDPRAPEYYQLNAGMHVALLLSKVEKPPQELSNWLKEMQA